MTPNNIVNMALLKGLDIIAITDHNSARNAGAIMEAGRKAGIIVVPGMELCTSEEFHMICLFQGLAQITKFDKYVYKNLLPIKNREDIFGAQIIMDAMDEETGREDRLLSGACNFDARTAIDFARSLGGVVIPSHVNRESYSMLNTLGAIPEEYNFRFLECSKSCRLVDFLQKHPELASYQFIRSSDAHFLSEILEQEVSFEMEEKSIKALLNLLKKPF
jgi:PHP family Zn ribbon phosphoesterase